LKAKSVPVVLKLAFNDRAGARGGRRGFGQGTPPATTPATPAPGTPTPPAAPGQGGRQGRRGPGGGQPGAPGAPGGADDAPDHLRPACFEATRRGGRALKVAKAAARAKRGVAFTFSPQGMPADRAGERFRENLGKAITEGGLTAEQALKALTVDAAKFLGMD